MASVQVSRSPAAQEVVKHCLVQSAEIAVQDSKDIAACRRRSSTHVYASKCFLPLVPCEEAHVRNNGPLHLLRSPRFCVRIFAIQVT